MPDAARFFAVVRPYPGLIRQRVLEFVEELGFESRDELTLPSGTPDGQAASWVGRQEMDLLVLPFHVHRDRHGDYVDGTGVAGLLAPGWSDRRIPILMPVSRFSWSARFPRRLDELRMRRPEIARQVVPMHESKIGDESIREALAAVLRGESDGNRPGLQPR